MDLVIFSHPDFFAHQSMPRFVKLLVDGMSAKGYKVEVWRPTARFFKLPVKNNFLKKWLGYIDQYIVFPIEIRKRIKNKANNTLYVFADHALGPWVPAVAAKPHVIHCHDFLAQMSALGLITENKINFTGRKYQNFIRDGYLKGKNFVAVSEKTRADLGHFLKGIPKKSFVVYNGLTQNYFVQDQKEARQKIADYFKLDVSNGYMLHVGGNDWYKNRTGVIHIYNSWRKITKHKYPLLLIGHSPSNKLLLQQADSLYKNDIYFLSGVADEIVRLAYCGAYVFLFPSLAEGFGWPIAEAMASGCPVITTNEAPMTEVAGDAAFLISRMPSNVLQVNEWATDSAETLDKVINLNETERRLVINKGVANANRFDPKSTINEIEKIYLEVFENDQIGH